MKKVLVSLLMALLVVPSIAQTDKDHDFKMAKNMDIFNAIYKNLDLMYVDTLDAEEVVGNGVKAMLGSLDPYTTYYPEWVLWCAITSSCSVCVSVNLMPICLLQKWD